MPLPHQMRICLPIVEFMVGNLCYGRCDSHKTFYIYLPKWMFSERLSLYFFTRCWSGNILGVGAVRQLSPEAGDHFGCWCCRPPVVSTEGGHYVIQLRKDVGYHFSFFFLFILFHFLFLDMLVPAKCRAIHDCHTTVIVWKKYWIKGYIKCPHRDLTKEFWINNGASKPLD